MVKDIQKILIVEDNTELQSLYQVAFENDDFEIMTAKNGIEGITKTVEFQPDLILLDLMMPQMDGFEVMQAIKNNSSVETIILANTNLDVGKFKEKALKNGADYFLQKSSHTPFEIVDIVKNYRETGHWK